MKKLTLILLSILMIVTLAACGDKCEHTYDNACDAICNDCEEIREVSAHQWEEADCDTPKTCKNCGLTEGEALGHSWDDADCTSAKTCTVCGATDGEALEHNYTDMGYDDYYHYQKCSMCGTKDEATSEMHTFDLEYSCECGVEFTVEAEEYLDGSVFASFYNESDLLIKDVYYEDGKLYDFVNYYYNENEDLIKSELYSADGTLDGYTIYEYDESGNNTKESYYDEDGTPDGYILHEYDENGNISKSEIYNEDGVLDYTEASEYNENGDRIKTEYTFPDGTIEINEYDENGKIVKGIYKDTDGYEYVIEYEYDENGNRTKESYEDTDGYEYVIEYEYDENRNLIKRKYASSYGFENVTEYEYDEDGNRTKESYEDTYGDKYVTEYEYDKDGNEIRSTKRFYDAEGNVIEVITEETEHVLSDDWQGGAGGHWHPCQNEGCSAGSEKEDHKDENEDAVCDICSYELGYAYDANTESYIVYTENGLEAVFALGGSAVLNNDIELTNYISVLNDVTLDLNGKAITSVDSFSYGTFISVESGTLTVTDSQGDGKIETTASVGIDVNYKGTLVVEGGSITSDAYALYIDGTVIVNGGIISYIFGAGNDGDISITITGGTILNLNASPDDISSITGGTFGRNPAEYLSSEYYAIYDETTEMWTVAKHDGIIDTYGELQEAVNCGGDVTLGASIDIGSNYIMVPEGVTVNLNLATYTLTGMTDVIINFGTLTVDGGTIRVEGAYAIRNHGTLTVNGGTFSSIAVPAIDNFGTLTVNGGTIEGNYAIDVREGTVKLVGNSFTLNGTYEAPVYWSSNNAYIDLSEYMGESFKIESVADMPLSNITLPEGWKLYDTNHVELTATTRGATIVAKPDISGGDAE